MQVATTNAVIPNRPIFRAQEVCELAELQPYVLRTWEAEFPDLGHARNGARVYRRIDVERVLRIKHLLFVDGLTLAGARRRLSEEGVFATPEPVQDADLAALVDEDTRQQLRDVRRGLQWILGVLSGEGLRPEDLVLKATPRGVSARSTGHKSGAKAKVTKHSKASAKKSAKGGKKR